MRRSTRIKDKVEKKAKSPKKLKLHNKKAKLEVEVEELNNTPLADRIKRTGRNPKNVISPELLDINGIKPIPNSMPDLAEFLKPKDSDSDGVKVKHLRKPKKVNLISMSTDDKDVKEVSNLEGQHDSDDDDNDKLTLSLIQQLKNKDVTDDTDDEEVSTLECQDNDSDKLPGNLLQVDAKNNDNITADADCETTHYNDDVNDPNVVGKDDEVVTLHSKPKKPDFICMSTDDEEVSTLECQDDDSDKLPGNLLQVDAKNNNDNVTDDADCETAHHNGNDVSHHNGVGKDDEAINIDPKQQTEITFIGHPVQYIKEKADSHCEEETINTEVTEIKKIIDDSTTEESNCDVDTNTAEAQNKPTASLERKTKEEGNDNDKPCAITSEVDATDNKTVSEDAYKIDDNGVDETDEDGAYSDNAGAYSDNDDDSENDGDGEGDGDIEGIANNDVDAVGISDDIDDDKITVAVGISDDIDDDKSTVDFNITVDEKSTKTSGQIMSSCQNKVEINSSQIQHVIADEKKEICCNPLLKFHLDRSNYQDFCSNKFAGNPLMETLSKLKKSFPFKDHLMTNNSNKKGIAHSSSYDVLSLDSLALSKKTPANRGDLSQLSSQVQAPDEPKLYFDMSAAKPGKLDMDKTVENLMKKSVLKDDLEKMGAAPKLFVSKNSMKLESKKKQEETAGKGWYNLPKTEVTDKIKNDLQLIKMRNVLDPKHHYKRNDSNKLPKYFQMGTVVEGAHEFYSARVPKGKRKKTMVDELLDDAEFRRKNKKKYIEIRKKQTSGGKGFYKKLKNKNKATWERT